MMSCYEVRAYLTQLQDDEVDQEYRARISSHLAQCAVCLKDMKELELIWDWIGEYPEIEPSLDFKDKFWQKAQEFQRPRPFFTRWATLLANRNWKLAALGASMMILLAIGYGVFPNYTREIDKFDNQLLQEVNRLVNTDLDESSLFEEGGSSKIDRQETFSHKKKITKGKRQ